MRSQHISMTWQEYELLPLKLGWKYEYWDGQTHISPRHNVVSVSVALQPRPIRSPWVLRPVITTDEPELIAAYIAAYSDTIDFCDWEANRIEAAAQKDIGDFLAGKRGNPLPASCVAVASHPETGNEIIIGAALIIAPGEAAPLLDMLFVLPEWHRKGIATTMVSAALNKLYRSGGETLASRYVLGNEESRAWHQRFGFVEETDLLLVRLYYRHAQHELRRRQQLGGLTEKDRKALTAEHERWKARVEEVEAIADQQGMEAVLPSLRWR
jgi:GNAT superfamily N-acetyltransferase